jgi:DNA polymerase zeta
MDSQDNNVFSMRIVALDHYLAPPVPSLDVTFSSLEGTSVSLVPIVRIFGATPSGQRVCLHLHQVRT